MAYSKQTWTDLDSSKPLSAARMGHIEDGIEQADLDVQAEAVTRAANDATEVTNRNNAITSAIATEVTNRNSAIASEASARDAAIAAAVAGVGWTTYRITTDLTRNAVTFADMVGLDAIPVVTGERYDFELDLDVSVSVTAASSVQLTMAASSGSGVTFSEVKNIGWFPASGNPGVDALYETADPITGTIGPSPGSNPGIDVRHMIRVVGSFLAGGSSGNIRFRGRISTVTGGGTATFRATASRCRIRKVVLAN